MPNTKDEKPIEQKPVTADTSKTETQSDSYSDVIEDQKGEQTAREHDHFQADSSLSSEN